MGTDRATRWSLTLNLKEVKRSTADECIGRARQLGWKVFGQLEEGKEGTEHYQLALQTPQVRFTQVKKVFPTAHIEVCREWNALMSYVTKEDTRKESLKTIETTYVSFKMVRDKFFEWVNGLMFERLTKDHDERLAIWDRFIGISIEEGIECDVIGMNAQYRACIAKYWTSYIRRQTDRQTEQNVVVPTIITDASQENSPSQTSDNSGRSSPCRSLRRIRVSLNKFDSSASSEV